MTNHLAADIRAINDIYYDEEVRQRYVNDLADRVERLGSDPVEVDASTELTADQEIRADALVAAARLLAPAVKSVPATQADVESLARRWLELAQYGEAWIATGGACPCTMVDDPECPLHGGESRRRSTDR